MPMACSGKRIPPPVPMIKMSEVKAMPCVATSGSALLLRRRDPSYVVEIGYQMFD